MRQLVTTMYPRLAILLFLVAACSGNAPEQTTVPGRWYTAAQADSGEALYQLHCAACHAADGSATAGWRKLDSSGHYPPPPLNGTAHTWHHPLEMLDYTIANGGVAFGGVMPGFEESLSSEERQAVIAWFQSLWPDDIYERWKAIEERSRN
jgi:mono/diheme cytochrome c family protein